jgi:pyruvate dehydrogenase E2 component (dihydrolipoamide acetyltransferase)
MATPVIMPRQGQSVESCIISKWHKKKGDKVETGDILFSYETDKASFDEEAKVSGVLLDVFFEEGDDVPCLMNVCVIGNEGESTAEYKPDSVKDAETESVTEIRETPQDETDNKESGEAESAPAIRLGDEKTVKISPRARKLSEKAGVDYRYADPSGPGGRIIERDITALIEAGPVFTAPAKEEHLKGEDGKAGEGTGLGGRITTGDISARREKTAAGQTEGTAADDLAKPDYEEVRIPNIRKVIARAMLHSLSSTAQLTLNASFDASDILEFRRKVKENRERLGFENITINDIIIFAVSRTLPNHRDLNAHFLEDRMLYFKNVNMGVAVDTQRGLMVPTIFNANLKKLNEISAEVKKLEVSPRVGGRYYNDAVDTLFT